MITFPRITCTNLAISITVSIWTIIQALLHTYVLLYIQWWRTCRLTYNDNYFTFLFGDVACDFNSTLIDDDIKYTEISNSWITYDLDKLILIYFVFDTLLLISSVGLLTGACCIIREIWALVFYLPWVVMSIIILVYDVFCTIYFAVHLPSDGIFLGWFSVFGLTNKITDVQDLENGSVDMIVNALAILMTLVSSKVVVIWVSNLICLVLIIKITRIEYNTKYSQNHYRNCESGQVEQIRVSKPEKTPIVRTNSQRIRDWYSYYGKHDHHIEKKAGTGDEEKFYDCIEDNNLFEVHNMSVLNTTKKNKLPLSVHSYEHSMPSTSEIPIRKISNADFSADKETTIDMPSTSSGNAMPTPRPIRIVTREVDEDDSETEDDFKPSAGREVISNTQEIVIDEEPVNNLNKRIQSPILITVPPTIPEYCNQINEPNIITEAVVEENSSESDNNSKALKTINVQNQTLKTNMLPSGWGKYTPEMLKNPKHEALKFGPKGNKVTVGNCRKTDLKTKLGQWAATKQLFVNTQEECFKREHELTMAHKKQKHEQEMRHAEELQQERLRQMRVEHELKILEMKGNK